MDASFPAVDTLFLAHAALAVSLSFLIGLEFHNYLRNEGGGLGFGTLRTLTLLGTTGFLFSSLDASRIFFCLGFLIVALWLGIYYRRRLQEGHASLIEPLVALLVYVLGLLAQVAPPWFAATYTVFIIFLLNAKPRLRSFADTVSGQEIATVAKFVIMAGIVLPLLPDSEIAAIVPVTYRATWFAVVAVSGISYLSYALQKYLFATHGTAMAGLMGGLYSSTAVAVVMGNGARRTPRDKSVSVAIILATAMMYVRLFVLAALLAPGAIVRLAPPFAVAAGLSVFVALLLMRLQGSDQPPAAQTSDTHPLEFHVALLFAVLFVVFATASEYVIGRYHSAGLETMAFLIGFTEIDPFVLSVLSGNLHISLHAAVDAVLLATASNNLMKAVFAAALARNRSVLVACLWLPALAVLSFCYVWF